MPDSKHSSDQSSLTQAFSLRPALAAFCLWFCEMAALLLLEHQPFVRRYLFQPPGYFVLIGIDISLWVAALATSLHAVYRGSWRQRMVVATPLLILGVFGVVALGQILEFMS